MPSVKQEQELCLDFSQFGSLIIIIIGQHDLHMYVK